VDWAQQTLELFTGEPLREELAPEARGQALLAVRRQDIEFRDIASGRVEIAVTVTNAAPSRSRMDTAVLTAAPFGAFVPWRPLAVLTVPPLDPGESVVLTTEARRLMPAPLGPPGSVPPDRVLKALLPEGDEQTSRVALPGSRRTLPVSPFDLVSGGETYWAGNLNVFIGGKSVERHQAKALRIMPEKTNLAMFVLGSGSDFYRFDLTGLEPRWEAALYGDALAAWAGRRKGTEIELGEWISFNRTSILMLALRPPSGCREGAVEVHVTRRSTGESAVVEFTFDPRACGPGCYVVD
jgi:hypothetical protein